MGKLEYLDALKRALAGLPPELQARTLAWYEQRFVDGVAAGRREEDVAQELGDPRQVAVTLRTSAHLETLKDKKPAGAPLRTLLSGLGLLVFNLFMAIPAAVYASLLVALYASAFGFYVSGIAITASGLAGANELVLSAPLQHVVTTDDEEWRRGRSQTRISISENGIHVFDEQVEPDEPALDPPADLAKDRDGDRERERERERSTLRVIRGAEAVAERKIQITTDLDPDSRTTQTLFGCGLILGGIALFLLALVISKYTLIGLRRYARMNMSLLRGS